MEFNFDVNRLAGWASGKLKEQVVSWIEGIQSTISGLFGFLDAIGLSGSGIEQAKKATETGIGMAKGGVDQAAALAVEKAAQVAGSATKLPTASVDSPGSPSSSPAPAQASPAASR